MSPWLALLWLWLFAAVAMTLDHNGRRVHDLPVADRWRTRIGDLFEREERLIELPGDYAAVADYVAKHAVPRN